jgi:glycosyltransferase involved in cell wall biosynthesis
LPDPASPWVIVTGGLHHEGGMDRANAALVDYLLAHGHPVHVVTHKASPQYHGRPDLHLHVVRRPLQSTAAGELVLASTGRQVARRLRRQYPGARLVANGANCRSDDVNWVHSVHRAWPCRDGGAPAWFRIKNRAFKTWARSRERRAISAARVVISNSNRTKNDLVSGLGVPASRIHTVYLGSDPRWVPPTAGLRARARSIWCRQPGRPLLAFVGALGHDTNKGIDRVLAAWTRLQADGWRAELIVAGGGSTERWRRIASTGGESIRFVGQTDRVGQILDAADLMVSPVGYEAYGLAVHEAVCRGLPVIVSADAGVVERLSGGFTDLLLRDSADVDDLVARIRAWAADPDGWRMRVAPIAAALRNYTENDMAARLVEVATADAA